MSPQHTQRHTALSRSVPYTSITRSGTISPVHLRHSIGLSKSSPGQSEEAESMGDLSPARIEVVFGVSRSDPQRGLPIPFRTTEQPSTADSAIRIFGLRRRGWRILTGQGTDPGNLPNARKLLINKLKRLKYHGGMPWQDPWGRTRDKLSLAQVGTAAAPPAISCTSNHPAPRFLCDRGAGGRPLFTGTFDRLEELVEGLAE